MDLLETVMRKIAVAGMLGLAAASCKTPSQPGVNDGVRPSIQVQPGKEFQLAVGQEAQIQGSAITVRFLKVSEDSRCPIDVNCVWAGNAAVRLLVGSGEGTNSVRALNSTLEPRAVYYGGYMI